MAVQQIKYKITWSKRGERENDEPVIITAHEYRAEGDFFAFYKGNPHYLSPSLVVRTSDVQEIREVHDDA